MTIGIQEKAAAVLKQVEGEVFRPDAIDAISQALIEAHKAGREEMREEAAKVLLEGYDRNVAIPYRRDGVASKNDQCAHGHYMYEDCEYCAATAIRNIT